MLVTPYTGVLGAALYVLSCEEPRPGTHERFVRPLWKQGAGSVTALIGFPMWIDLIIEYIVGFGFGLFIFQALFMKGTMGGSCVSALKRSLLPEWLSRSTRGRAA